MDGRERKITVKRIRGENKGKNGGERGE